MMKSRATGSGVIIDESGLVVTNHHVAGKATGISCRLHDGEEVMADLLGADPMTDLAVLRLRIGERSSKALPLTVAKFGNSDQVRVGDTCFAMGSPAGLSQSVTRGIISNVAMMSPNLGSFRLDGESVGELVRWLGHDAVIFPGGFGAAKNLSSWAKEGAECSVHPEVRRVLSEFNAVSARHIPCKSKSDYSSY